MHAHSMTRSLFFYQVAIPDGCEYIPLVKKAVKPAKVGCVLDHLFNHFTPFTPGSAKSTIDKCSKITNWVKLKNKHQSKVLLNSFPMNGVTLGFCTWNQKFDNSISLKITLRIKGLIANREAIPLC